MQSQFEEKEQKIKIWIYKKIINGLDSNEWKHRLSKSQQIDKARNPFQFLRNA